MYEKKIEGKEASLIARKYFEEIWKTQYLYFEIIKVNFDEKTNIWNVEADVQPLYSNQKKRFKFEISAEGEVKNVEQTSASAKV